MREELLTELMVMLQPMLNREQLEEARMRATIILAEYEISKRETELTVWEEDKNDVVIRKWLSAKAAAGMSPRTIQFYGKSVPNFFNKVQKNYDEITADDLRLYFAVRVQKDRVSKVTADNERRCLSSFYGWLQKEEILLRNPMAKLDSIKKTKKKKKAYDLMDLEKIRLGCRTAREKAIVEILASTWCRVSELVGIQLDDIDGDRIIVHGKGDKEREVYLNARSKLALEVYLQERKDTNPYLFPRSKNAGKINNMIQNGHRKKELPNWYKDPEMVDEYLPTDKGTIESIVRNLGRRVGVDKVHPHRFRRTGATMALRQGMPLTTVSKLLGHESIATTQIYLDISDEEMADAHKKYVV